VFSPCKVGDSAVEAGDARRCSRIP